MVEFLVILFWLIVAGLAAIGAVRVFEWLDGGHDRAELAEREHQADMKIQAISYQAQMAMLDEALRRSRSANAQSPRSDVIDGEVVSSEEDPRQPL